MALVGTVTCGCVCLCLCVRVCVHVHVCVRARLWGVEEYVSICIVYLDTLDDKTMS